MFQVWQGIPGINLQVFPVSTWEQGHFFVFLHFSNFGLQNLQKYSSKFLWIYCDNKKGPLNKCAKFHRNICNQMAEAMI